MELVRFFVRCHWVVEVQCRACSRTAKPSQKSIVSLISTCWIVEGLLGEIEVTLQAEGVACAKAARCEGVKGRSKIYQEFNKPSTSQEIVWVLSRSKE